MVYKISNISLFMYLLIILQDKATQENNKMIHIRLSTYIKLLTYGKLGESLNEIINRLMLGYVDNKYNKAVKQ